MSGYLSTQKPAASPSCTPATMSSSRSSTPPAGAATASPPGHRSAAPPAEPLHAAHPALPHVPLWLLALFVFSGTLGMHIFVPALPFAAESLGATPAALQLTVSLYVAGLAVGQLVYGPISDRFGRRPTLMVGLALYVAGGLAASLSPNVHLLIAARLFQALGGCAGLVLGRTIVRDTSGFEQAAKRLAVMNMMITIGPGLAPIIGATLATLFGWRSIFYALTALGAVGLLCSWKLLPETGAARVGVPIDIRVLARNYGLLLKSPAFLGYSIGGGCSTTAIYAFIATAPFIFVHQLHRPVQEAGAYLALLTSGMWLGSVIVARIIHKVKLRTLMVVANGVSIVAAAVFLAVGLTGHLSVAAIVIPMFIFSVGAAVASPAALTEAISVNPVVTGSASGLYGFWQMAVGALCTALASLGADPAIAAGVVLVGAGLVGQTGFYIASRSQPEPAD